MPSLGKKERKRKRKKERERERKEGRKEEREKREGRKKKKERKKLVNDSHYLREEQGYKKGLFTNFSSSCNFPLIWYYWFYSRKKKTKIRGQYFKT